MKIKLSHPNILDTKVVQRIDNQGNLRTVLVITTDLAISSFEDTYDAQKYGSFVETISDYLKDSSVLDAAEIIPK